MTDTAAAEIRLESLLPPLKAESLQCLYRFMRYKAAPFPLPIPERRQAAVAIVADARLFVGRLGDLYVLLSTRAGNMRSYASDTALPGGKYEPGDSSPEYTARREAYEEIGLPMDNTKVICLSTLDIFLTGNGLLVTPVVLLVTDNTINPILNPSEVTHLFSMPLTSFLHVHPSKIPGWNYGLKDRSTPFLPASGSRPPSNPTSGTGPASSVPPILDTAPSSNLLKDKAMGEQKKRKELAPIPIPIPPLVKYAEGDGVVGGKEGYYQYRDIPWGKGTVRFHRFLTGKEADGIKPVYGLTSAILIHAAVIGYDTPPAFDRSAPGQLDMFDRIYWEVMHGKGPLRRAIEAEGLSDEWERYPYEARARAKL